MRLLNFSLVMSSFGQEVEPVLARDQHCVFSLHKWNVYRVQAVFIDLCQRRVGIHGLALFPQEEVGPDEKVEIQ